MLSLNDALVLWCTVVIHVVHAVVVALQLHNHINSSAIEHDLM